MLNFAGMIERSNFPEGHFRGRGAAANRLAELFSDARVQPMLAAVQIRAINGDVADCELSSFCREGAVVLAAVNDAARRFAVAFGHH